MADITWDEAVYVEVVNETGAEAVAIVADRIVEDAKPRTKTRTTRDMAASEYYYSKPDGRLRASIHHEESADAEGPMAEIFADVPLGYFRNIGGRGKAAYGGTRGNNPALAEALDMQIGRPIP